MSNTIGQIHRLVPGLIEKPVLNAATENAPDKSKAQFADIFSNLINSVNEIQQASGDAEKALLAGEPVELHDVMIKAEEAGVAMDLLLEIRNKLLSGYQELMRMPM